MFWYLTSAGTGILAAVFAALAVTLGWEHVGTWMAKHLD